MVARVTEPSCADAAELGVRVVEYVNHAYVQGDEQEVVQAPATSRVVGGRVTATPEEKKRVVRNVSLLSIAFMLTFMIKYGLGNLQSSLNVAKGLGTLSLTATYCGLVLSNAILPPFLLRWLGSKWTMAVSFFLMAPYVGLQYHPSFYTLIPASFLAGIIGAPMGAAANKYLAAAAETYCDITGMTIDVVIPRFFGTFLMFCQMAQVWGNLIPTIVITFKEKAANASEEFISQNCGINFCQNVAGNDPNFKQPRDETLLFLLFIFFCILIVAIILVTSCIDSLTRYCDEKEISPPGVTALQTMNEAFNQLFLDRKLQLLVPITFWIGFEQAFLNADFTASYVSCAWGLRGVGFVMATYGLTNAFFSLSIRWLVRLIGRVPAIMIAFLLHLSICAVLIMWHPTSSTRHVYFIISVMWGIADAIWIVQIISLYGVLSPGKEEAAFSNYDLWLSLGFIVGFGISSLLCTDLKVYLMLGLLLTGMATYLLMEWQRRRQKQAHTPEHTKDIVQ